MVLKISCLSLLITNRRLDRSQDTGRRGRAFDFGSNHIVRVPLNLVNTVTQLLDQALLAVFQFQCAVFLEIL